MSEYSAVPSSGKLKLKGVKDSRVDKKKKKSKGGKNPPGHGEFSDNSVVLKRLESEDEDAKINEETRKDFGEVDGEKVEPRFAVQSDDVREHLKTDAEKRYDEQRRKRLEKKLQREGVKTHKERVEELNRYLSNLSEHHDMPKIGPG